MVKHGAGREHTAKNSLYAGLDHEPFVIPRIPEISNTLLS